MEELQSIYSKYGYPGKEKLFTVAQKEGLDVTRQQINDFYAKQEVAQLHAPAPANVKSTPITVDGNIELQMDLLDFNSFYKSNSNFKWCLIVESVWNRQAAAIPIKTKSPTDVLPALKQALKELKIHPVQIVSDSGSEWKGVVAEYFKEQNIVNREVELHDSHALGLINRFSQVVKRACYKHFTYTKKNDWVHFITDFVSSYNNTPHAALKALGDQKAMSPNEASENETDVRHIHVENKLNSMTPKQQKKMRSPLAIGDHVRILRRKEVFDRGYEILYSLEVFTITGIEEGVWYRLNDGRRFREGSLKKVTKPLVKENDAIRIAPPLESSELLAKGSNNSETLDNAREEKREHRVEQILKFQEGVSQDNVKRQLRPRVPTNQLEDVRYGRIKY